MTKFIFTSIAVFALIAAPVAFADHHGGKKGGKMFERMDSDGDGLISAAEHIAAAQERFAKMDINGDGFVSKEEAKEMRGKIKKNRDNINE